MLPAGRRSISPAFSAPSRTAAASRARRRRPVHSVSQFFTKSGRWARNEAHRGVCCICGNRIIGGRWVDEHIRPLSLGGSNDLANRAPAHERCAQEKTRDDLRRLAKAKAQKRAHLGLKAATRLIASRPFPASERVRPNLSPLGPPRAARYADGDAPDPAGDAEPTATEES